ncbi:hypothetical protein [Actinophytocola sp.]|uniref:hypothetical protein n=1 Tax=Actinophytocola sp. TaxID=1872138 RepID=UPI002EDA27C4
MTEGFRVDPTQLQDYIDALKESQLRYDEIEDQLTEADLTTADPDFATLVGHPELGGTQAEFTAACRTFLTTYRDLYTEIHALHHQISGKLNYLVQAFVETNQLYQHLDSTHATVFDGLLDRHASGGGSNGATDLR